MLHDHSRLVTMLAMFHILCMSYCITKILKDKKCNNYRQRPFYPFYEWYSLVYRLKILSGLILFFSIRYLWRKLQGHIVSRNILLWSLRLAVKNFKPASE
jgi:hypothetical protein